MVFRRKIYDKLLSWKQSEHSRSALLINGARWVGKSFIVEEFAKREYRNYVPLDFTRVDGNIKKVFDEDLGNLDTFFYKLSSLCGKPFYERETLFIFDEVQSFPRAREAIKALVEHGKYDYIETGSLVSIRENVKNILIPSEEVDINMYPMDFEEFLWAKGNETLMDAIRVQFDMGECMGVLHQTAMAALREYMIVGGMPKVVDTFLETRDLKAVDEEKRKILSLYRKGIREHSHRQAERTEALFDFLPSLLQRHEKKIVLSDIEPGARMRDYQDQMFWLQDAMIVNPAHNATEPNVGLGLSLDHSTVKCYMADTGLLISHAFGENELMAEDIHNRLLFSDIALNEGMLTENVVAQMLAASGNRLYFFSRHDRDNRENCMEIDFLVSNSRLAKKNNVYPIEVKSGRKVAHRSLDKFRKKYADWLATPYLLWDRDYEVRDGIVCLPLYMAPLLASGRFRSGISR